jgi:hypothetical protein
MGTAEVVGFLEWPATSALCGRAALRVHKRPSARIARHGLTRGPAGWRLHVRFPFSSTAGSLSRYGPRLASAFRAREVRVASVIEDAREGVITLVKRDPLAAPLAYFPPPYGDIWQPVNLGVDEGGYPVTVTLPEHTVLVAGRGRVAALSADGAPAFWRYLDADIAIAATPAITMRRMARASRGCRCRRPTTVRRIRDLLALASGELRRLDLAEGEALVTVGRNLIDDALPESRTMGGGRSRADGLAQARRTRTGGVGGRGQRTDGARDGESNDDTAHARTSF